MYEKLLIQAGLSETQAEIYEFLIGHKELKASEIALKTGRVRGVVYKIVEELFLLGLVEKIENKGVIRFRAEHPQNLAKVLALKEQKVKTELEEKNLKITREKELVLRALPELTTQFNFTYSKPAVRYYDGRAGMVEAFDYLTSQLKEKTELISFVKVLEEKKEKENRDVLEAVDRNDRKRLDLDIKMRSIAIRDAGGEILKVGDYAGLRETRLVDAGKLILDFPGGEIYIYEDEVLSFTVENERHFAFTIKSKAIAQLLRAFFETEWALL
jgi:sugar-specific transcriptional regulator TrmB